MSDLRDRLRALGRRGSVTRALAGAALCLGGCGSTVAGTARDAGAPGDVAPGTCDWRAGAAVDLPALLAGFSTAVMLADVATTGDEVWVLRANDTTIGAAASRGLAFNRVAADGTLRGHTAPAWGASGSPWPGGESFVADAALGRRALLVTSGGGGGGGQFTLVGSDAAVAEPVTLERAAMGLGLDHFQSLLAHRAGYTCTATRATAPWGVSLVRLDPRGDVVSARDLEVADHAVEFTRLALARRDFMMVWREGAAATGGALSLRRYDEDGNPLSPSASLLDARGGGVFDVALVAAGDGLQAIWGTVTDPATGDLALVSRRLTRDGSPAGAVAPLALPAPYHGAMHAAAAHGDTLVVALVDPGDPRVVLLALGPDGRPRAAPLTIAHTEPPTRPWGAPLRVVETGSGALVVFTRNGETVSVVPLRCEAPARRP